MFDVVNKLKSNGVAIVYVSHRMKEIFEIANKVTVLRDGKKSINSIYHDTTEDELISSMVGQEVGNLYPEKSNEISKEPVLSVKNFYLTNRKSVSFNLYKGEILGFYGLVGSGTHTLAERLFGLKKKVWGQ